MQYRAEPKQVEAGVVGEGIWGFGVLFWVSVAATRIQALK